MSSFPIIFAKNQYLKETQSLTYATKVFQLYVTIVNSEVLLQIVFTLHQPLMQKLIKLNNKNLNRS